MDTWISRRATLGASPTHRRGVGPPHAGVACGGAVSGCMHAIIALARRDTRNCLAGNVPTFKSFSADPKAFSLGTISCY